MEKYLNYLIVVFVLIILFSIVYIIYRIKNKQKKTALNMDELCRLFNKNDVTNIQFVRNKIVVCFNDINNFNVELLHDTYAKGITVVGDKIKFFVSEDQKTNEKAFKSIKSFIER